MDFGLNAKARLVAGLSGFSTFSISGVSRIQDSWQRVSFTFTCDPGTMIKEYKVRRE